VALGVRSRTYFTSLIVVFFKAIVESKTVADCSGPKTIVTEAAMAASCYFSKAVELAIGRGCSPMVAEVAAEVVEGFSSMVAGQVAELATEVVEHFSSMVAGQVAELATEVVEHFSSMVARLAVKAAAVEGCCSIAALATPLLVFSQVHHSFPIG